MTTGHPLALFCVTVVIAVSSNGLVNGQQKADYHIDVLVFVDYAFYDNWLKETNMSDSPQAQKATKEYIAYLFQGVNRRYRAITNLPFNISVHVSQVKIATTPEDAPWTESVKTDTGSSRPQVNATAVLENLIQFVTDNSDNSSTLPQFDHLMLFTRYDLVGNAEEGNYTAGLAYVGTICTNSSVSIIEDDGGAVSEATAVHELAHSLGALHDGNNNSCNPLDLFAMTNRGANPFVNASDAHKKLNLWTFSNCSTRYFNDTVQKLKREGLESCLLTKRPPVDVPPVPDNLPTPPDQQCRHIYNDSSYFCRMPYTPPNSSLDDLCLIMACYNPYLAGEKCTVHTADAGTCCGQGKWCQQGRCVENQLNSRCSNINDSCPFGDQPANIKGSGGRTCDKLEKNHCYTKELRAKCCEHCEKHRTNDVDCEYGDIKTNCEVTPCGNATYAEGCCGTCEKYQHVECKDIAGSFPINYVNKSTSQTDVLTGSCSSFVAERRMLCYVDSFLEACCQSCEEARTNDSSCLFGDRRTGCSEEGCAQDPSLITKDCCQTCRTTTTSTPIPTTATTTYTTTVTAASTTTTPAETTTTPVPTTTTIKTTPTETTTTPVPTTTTIKTTPKEAMTSKPTSTITPTTRELTTTTTTTPTTTTKATTTISTKARTTPTPVRDQCIPLLGVRTCGCAALTTNLALLLIAMALIVAITM